MCVVQWYMLEYITSIAISVFLFINSILGSSGPVPGVAHTLPIQTQEEEVVTQQHEAPTKQGTTQLSVQWFPKPVPLEDRHWVTVEMGAAPEYVELGTTDTGDHVIGVSFACEGMCDSDHEPPYFLIEKKDRSQVYFLTAHLRTWERENMQNADSATKFGGTWAPIVQFTDTLVLKDLSSEDIELSKGDEKNTLTAVNKPIFDDLSSKEYTYVHIPTLAGFVRAVSVHPAFEKYPSAHLERIFKKLPAGMVQEYTLTPDFVSDDAVPAINWNDGEKNTATYRKDGASGCGGMGAVLVDQNKHTTSEWIRNDGMTNRGAPIYSGNKTHPLVSFFYTASGGKKITWNSETQESVVTPFTIDDFVAHHGVIFYTDLIGRNLVYSNSDYGPQVECGKPVIYLYPEQTTDVSVHVGAQVTVSEPQYHDGWSGVAHPDGHVDVSGVSYPYLFWEGTGHGLYPTISKGVIVPTRDVQTTITSHLLQLGLHENEINDFLGFWMPRMPQTPFVRLSWLGISDMNELAPLSISPRPDTMIRVFLDFEGVIVPYVIERQTFTSLPRKGFTVVEWGGLLRK